MTSQRLNHVVFVGENVTIRGMIPEMTAEMLEA